MVPHLCSQNCIYACTNIQFATQRHTHAHMHALTVLTVVARCVIKMCGKKRYGSLGGFTLYRTHSYTLLILQLNISPCHCGHICRKYFVADFIQLYMLVYATYSSTAELCCVVLHFWLVDWLVYGVMYKNLSALFLFCTHSGSRAYLVVSFYVVRWYGDGKLTLNVVIQ